MGGFLVKYSVIYITFNNVSLLSAIYSSPGLFEHISQRYNMVS